MIQVANGQIYQSLCPNTPLPKPRMAAVRSLHDPTNTSSSVLDTGALVLYFPAPKTVTGEDVLELHVHGGPAIVKSVLAAISRLDRTDRAGLVRYAEPGEFTRRAFMNNRLALPQVEALGETLAADTEQQRRLAVRGSTDTLARRYESWRHRLLYARGELEALIDFAEDQDFEESSEQLIASVADQLRALRAQIALHVQNASKGELLRSGIRIALLGAPNAGKSSLLNRVVGKEAAIVSTEEGTTRDIVDVGVDLGGWFCKLGDMAGIRSAGDGAVVIGAVEKEGIRRARARALESDVVIVVVSLEYGAGAGADGEPPRLSVEPEVASAVNDCAHAGKCLLVAFNKCDRLPERVDGRLRHELAEAAASLFPAIPTSRVFAISCQDALAESSADPGGIQTFLRGLITAFEEIASPSGVDNDQDGKYDVSYWEDSLGVTHRQSSSLQRCLAHITDFLAQTDTAHPDHAEGDEAAAGVDIVTAAEHLRAAADALAKITGKGESGDVEDVLGVVFEKFCVGK
ncbi:hypothetical protein PHISP_02269 [Aspergillus sp. HF37]|nr:hypothetical protein PHISP_02269 [Aspergillus sp. HF37]